VNVTLTPPTGEPPASVTFTLGGALTAVPAGAVWVVTELAAIVVAVPTATVNGADPTRPSLVPMMFVVPNATAVTSPVADTVATAVFELDQVTTRPVSTPPIESRATALACVVPLTMIDDDASVTVTVATGTGITLTLLDPVTPSEVASMRAAPGLTPRTRPLLDTTATALLLDDHVTGRPSIT
jgi:hypothetical protein